ncbi:nuclear transport factor 2 family protein [Dyadobacter sp. Leaf189]|uniref:nuclear transport factor 2 family protein n=1 Tax=Dyadobacter sp. Leaf189 TaxID=1736295 RepID=UPI0006FA4E10|nr:nuclear transport factor 2 family protein [Dyadobacter sp. Leaf189]KQS26558.1 hypothetical protein ASG33_18400 [Dyadobacter sp. Leaf189]
MNTRDFANSWLQSWNNHDIEGVLSHFSEDVQVTTPMIKIATGGTENTLYGKDAVRDYWNVAILKFPDLHFKLLCITEGVDSVALYYETVMNKTAIEVMFFDENNLVKRMDAFYSLSPE